MLYSLSVYGLGCLVAIIVVYYRHLILPHLPLPYTNRGYVSLSDGSFSTQRAAGLHSGNFDIESNLQEGDSRMGLDDVGAAEIRAIMHSHRVGFDQARLIRQNQIFAANGIGPDGMPLDSKAVSRL